MAYLITTRAGTPLADQDGLIVFEMEASAARFLLSGELIVALEDEQSNKAEGQPPTN